MSEEVQMKEKVNIEKWSRKNQFGYFNSFAIPHVNITSKVKVDNIVRYAKDNNLSFYGLMSYMVTKTVNEIEQFKYCLFNGEVFKYDYITSSVTVLDNNNDVQFTSPIKCCSYKQYMRDFKKEKEYAESGGFSNNDEPNSLYLSCLPKIRFTSITNPINIHPNNSIPIIIWGKYFLQDGEYYIDLSIQVHHGLLDGYHISQFYQKLEDNIEKFSINQ